MLQIIYYILFSIVLLFGLYFALLSIFTFVKRKSPIKIHDAKTKFAVLIAARNEAAVIGDLIESLKVQKYPTELYDIYALVNNCTDQTEKVARDTGARIMRIDAPVKCKGDVMKYAFAKLKPLQRLYYFRCGQRGSSRFSALYEPCLSKRVFGCSGSKRQ